MSKTTTPLQRPWVPLERSTPNPAMQALRTSMGVDAADEVWGNDLYQITVQYMSGMVGDTDVKVGPEGFMHLSMKRHDRQPMGDWRHYQAIKNEIAGPEREAVQIYPAESRLVDTANEYHLWVFPEGFVLPFGFTEQLLFSDKQVKMYNDGRSRGDHKGRQRAWQPGLPVAEGRNTKPDADEDPMNGVMNPTQMAILRDATV